MNLKNLLEDISNNQMVDICCGIDENNTLRTPKTIFYGKAIDAYARRKELEDFWRRGVVDISAYVDAIINVDNAEKEYISVIMITLKDYSID